MLRQIVFPAALVLGSLTTILAFVIWYAYHSDYAANTDWLDKAYAGNIAAQRHLAKCYSSGCPDYVAEPILACSWRHVIVGREEFRSH